jgi:hypothetical protein
MLEFGEWLPDLPDYENPGITVATNVIPAGKSYKSVSGLTVYSNALSSQCLGAVLARDTSGNTANFVGNSSKLYKLASAAFSDVSKVGGYTVSTDDQWEFTLYGTQVLATQISDPIQTFTVASSTKFADLAAGAPKARHISNMRNFIVVGNTFDATDGNVPHRVRWSAFKDPTSWTVSASTQADYNDLDASKGWVQRIIGGESGVVFQERAISIMSYQGSPLVFRFDEVEKEKGLLAPNGAIKIGNRIFYLGIDGFYMFDGNQSIPIGDTKVNRTFFADLDQTYASKISTAIDFTNQCVFLLYPGSGHVGGRCNKIMVYNYAINRFASISTDLEYLFSAISEGYTLDSLDTVSTSIDALAFSLDSRVWTGNTNLLAAFDSNHKLNYFTGTAMTATLETGETQLTPGNRTDVRRLRPVVDGTSATTTMQVGTRNKLSDTVTWGSSLSLNSTGEFCTRSNARFHRARVSVSGGFNHLQGIQILEAAKAGQR